jgi:glycerol-3-phosphate acyltransferase PlsX
MITLAVDCMGGDHGTSVTLPACLNFLNNHPDAKLICVVLEGCAKNFSHPRATLLECPEIVEMHDPLETALRRKKKSSMRISIEQVKEGHAHVAISAGNTGALMAIARYILKTIDGIERPAIAGQLPNVKGGGTTMLDLGANVDCTPEHLLQFAVMGSALVSVLYGIDEPTVGLLNIGEEAIKGSEMIKKTSELMHSAAHSGDLNFYGNIEGNDIFKGTTDIVVCDGFVGNVALKASEGLASMVSQMLKEGFSSNIFTKLSGIIAHPALSAFKKRVDHRRHNGAALLGLQGLVFKSHGSADILAFENSLNRAYDAVSNHLLEKVRVRISHAAPFLASSQLGKELINSSFDE